MAVSSISSSSFSGERLSVIVIRCVKPHFTSATVRLLNAAGPGLGLITFTLVNPNGPYGLWGGASGRAGTRLEISHFDYLTIFPRFSKNRIPGRITSLKHNPVAMGMDTEKQDAFQS